MSGTSLDGIDAALVEIVPTDEQPAISTLATLGLPYSVELHERLLNVAEGQPVPVAEVSALHRDVAVAFADCAGQLMAQAGVPAGEIDCIGSHGQTVHHQPPTAGCVGHTLQLGDGALIAELTGIATVSNFRNRDMAAGGQGAPLVPLVDYLLFSHPERHRCIQNLGGIGNVTFLEAAGPSEAVLAFDTGPANLLIDGAMGLVKGVAYDAGGATASRGTVHPALLESWLADPYFQLPPPKSTGREAFGSARVRRYVQEAENLKAEDLLATISELTVQSIVRAYRDFLPHPPDEVFLGGGGVHNLYIRERLALLLAPARVESTSALGIDSDFKEAIAFAVLAWLRCRRLPGNLPSVTGARRAVLLGDLHGGEVGVVG